MIGVEIPLRGDAAVRFGPLWGVGRLCSDGLRPGLGSQLRGHRGQQGRSEALLETQGAPGAWTQVPLPRHPCCSGLTLPCPDLPLKVLLLK